jgi:translocation and assembly module TamB
MSRRAQIVRNMAIGLAALLAIVVVALLIVVQTAWFRGFATSKIVTAIQGATGGRTEIGSFTLDPMHLRAVITDLVIHGYEPPGSAPYLRVRRAEVDVRIFTSLQHVFKVAYLGLDSPQANIRVLPDGSTNVPVPKTTSTSKETPLETVVDLAVGRFELTNGLLTFNSQQRPLNVRANNLRVQLAYHTLMQGYQGQISLDPLYVASGQNTPVNFTLSVPVALWRDRIDVKNARISTARSEILINGSIENLRNPRTSAHLNGHVALADLKNAANLPLELNTRNVPEMVDLDADAMVADNAIRVAGLRLAIGHSNIEASGKLKDAADTGPLEFRMQFALGELGRLAGLAARPEGTVFVDGTARLDASNNYLVIGNLKANDLSVQQASGRIGHFKLSSAIHLDPHRLDLQGLLVAAFGAEVVANVSLEDFARFRVDGNLRHLELREAARSFGQSFPYDATVLGPISAQGDLKTPGTKALAARAQLSIAPGRHGIPISGHLNAAYDGKTDNLELRDSAIVLPHSRLDLNGSLGTRLNVALTSRDLHDLLAAAPAGGRPPMALNGGQLGLMGTVTGPLTSPHISGHLAVNQFQVEARRFDALAMDLNGASTGAAISHGTLTRGAMQAEFNGSVGLKDWKAAANQPLAAHASVRQGDLADVMALAGAPSAGYSGALFAEANVNGTLSNPRGTASLQIANGTIQNEAFDSLQIQVHMTDQLVTIPTASIIAGAGRIDLTAEFRHPRDSFATGQLHAHMRSNQVDLARLRNLQRQRPNTAGQIQIDADLTGGLSQAQVGSNNQTEFIPSGVNTELSARGVRVEGQNYGDLTASARTNGQTVTYNISSDFAGSNLRLNGNTQLTPGYPTTADANIAHLPVDRVLALAKQDFPAKGSLSGTAHFRGTTGNPEGQVDLDLTSAEVYGEPLDRVRARVTYTAKSIDVPQFEITSGAARLELTARYDHAPLNFQSGSIQFHVNSSRIDLTRIRNVQKIRPEMGGTLQVTANGAATVSETAPRVAFRDLNADVAAKAVTAQGKNFGNVTLTAHTNSGRLDFALDSDLASSAIHGSGSAQLGGDYPATVIVTFDNVAWTRIQTLLGQGGETNGFEAIAAGQVDVNGPITKTNELHGSLQLTRVQLLTGLKPGVGARGFAIENQGPITATLDQDVVRLQSLHLTGPKMDLQATGSFSLQTQAVTASVKANSSLDVLQRLSAQIVSSGDVTIAADVRGTTAKPSINGRMELHNASVNYTEIPNGITNANGVVQFNGNSAAVQNLTAEVGGGKLNLSGHAAYGDVPRFGLRANATNVRVRLQPDVSALADANLQLTGGMQSSMVMGTVTLNQITYAPTSDFGSILSRAAPPVQNASGPSPLLDNMKLDVQVRTSPSIAVQAAMAENLQLDANLRVRGTASQPGVQGRVTITEGQLLFFSSTYTVNTGTISFYNPVRIEPILNLSLETQAQGVDIVLRVTGPIDNMKLSYTSDPPLQFQEIVALLAAGKTPTSDPNILVNQPSPPPQTFQQMGESAIVSKALADPLASRLQRVFGVSQLSIDPTFTGGSDLPQARVTLKQRITSNMTFTYVTAVNDPNTQIVRVEWAVSPQWSAIAGRDQNGLLSVRFLYKKQFR